MEAAVMRLLEQRPMKMEGSAEREHSLTTFFFLFKGNLKDQLSFAKHVLCATVDFLSDLRMVVTCFLKDSVKYYGESPTIASTETLKKVSNLENESSSNIYFDPHILIQKLEKLEKDQMMKKRKMEEKTTCDPFRVRLSFSLAQKLKMTILGVFLVPIRFISVFVAVTLAWTISCIGLVGLDNNNIKPVTGWRKQLQGFIGALGRATCTCFGFSVSKTGTQAICC